MFLPYDQRFPEHVRKAHLEPRHISLAVWWVCNSWSRHV